LDYTIFELELLFRMGQQYYGYPLRTRSSRRLVGTLSPSSSSLPFLISFQSFRHGNTGSQLWLRSFFSCLFAPLPRFSSSDAVRYSLSDLLLSCSLSDLLLSCHPSLIDLWLQSLGGRNCNSGYSTRLHNTSPPALIQTSFLGFSL
jgi:hypothetical protein